MQHHPLPLVGGYFGTLTDLWGPLEAFGGPFEDSRGLWLAFWAFETFGGLRLTFRDLCRTLEAFDGYLVSVSGFWCTFLGLHRIFLGLQTALEVSIRPLWASKGFR